MGLAEPGEQDPVPFTDAACIVPPVVVGVTRAQLEDALDALGEASNDGDEIVWLRIRRSAARADRAAEDRLTTREHDVVELVAQGLSNIEIADRLYISKRTVESHLEHVKEKLGHGSRHQVMAWALCEQLHGRPSVYATQSVG